MHTLPTAICVHPFRAAEYSPFYGIEKGAVLQEARIFHDPNLDPRRCSQVGVVPGISQPPRHSLAPRGKPMGSFKFHNNLQVITKLLYLLNQGETFTKVGARARRAHAHALLRFELAAL